MYGTQTSVLASTGAASVSILGMHLGVVQLMIAGIAVMASGVVLYRLGTRKAKYVPVEPTE